MSNSNNNFLIIILMILATLGVLVLIIIFVLPMYLQSEINDSRENTRDALGESALANLRSRAEIFAFNNFDISYEGWCEAIEDNPPGLEIQQCVDDEDTWALSARTTGINNLKCVDSENGVVDGDISAESGLCEQGEIQSVTTTSSSGENQITTQSNLTTSKVEAITNESIEKIRSIADELDGIELQIVTAIPNLDSGETKEWRGMTLEPVGDYPVIRISGTAATRADLAGGIQANGFLGELLAVPNFDALLPTNVLTQASDIEFDMVVVVDWLVMVNMLRTETINTGPNYLFKIPMTIGCWVIIYIFFDLLFIDSKMSDANARIKGVREKVKKCHVPFFGKIGGKTGHYENSPSASFVNGTALFRFGCLC